MPVTLSQLLIYPVKSTAGLALSRALIDDAGLALDRRFMLTDLQGRFITARTHPRLLHVRASLVPGGLWLSAPGQSPLKLDYAGMRDTWQRAEIWGDSVEAQHPGRVFDAWFSAVLGEPCRLVFFGSQSRRATALRPDKPVGFADGYPLLIASQASLEALNQALAQPVTMAHFRPNLVARGCEAFAEDTWQRLRIGEVEFEQAKPCARCILTTRDPQTGLAAASGEPLKTLQTYRADSQGEALFGQNLVALNEGIIEIGDRIEIMHTQPAIIPAGFSRQASQTSTQVQLRPWTADHPVRLRCQAIDRETANTLTLRFERPPGYACDYQAGQFVTLWPVIDGQQYARCYTLSSAPGRTADISITVKRQHGTVSNWLFDTFQPGDTLAISGPGGGFTLPPAPRPLVMIAAGSGITPFLSMIRESCDRRESRSIRLIYQVRHEADLIGRAELELLQKYNPALELVFVLSQPPEGWQGRRGRLNASLLKTLLPKLNSHLFMCCGPDAFMDMAQLACKAYGVAPEDFSSERFSAPPPHCRAPQAQPPQNVEIELRSWGCRFNGDNARPLLEQAEDQGISLPFSCRAGICGTCKVRLVSGNVIEHSTGSLSDQERQAGIILACSCTPQPGEPVVVESRDEL